MRIIQVGNQVDGGRVAFELLKEKLAEGAKTIGLATGSSPLSFYEQAFYQMVLLKTRKQK